MLQLRSKGRLIRQSDAEKTAAAENMDRPLIMQRLPDSFAHPVLYIDKPARRILDLQNITSIRRPLWDLMHLQ